MAISTAEQLGITVEQWYEGRIAIKPEPKYVHMFFDLLADRELERSAMRSLAEQYVAAVYEKVLGVLR